MRFDEFIDTPEELYIGALLQFPLYFIVGWWVFPIMFISGILWRLGGWKDGNKLFRKLGVPVVVTSATCIFTGQYSTLLAIPFMIWLVPAYGKTSFFFMTALRITNSISKANFISRSLTYLLYWLAYFIALLLPF